jgi:hypothetical protein
MDSLAEVPMDPSVARLETPDECEQFAKNVAAEHPELAAQARRKSVELLAAVHEAKTEAEREALCAVYAYEKAASQQRGRKVTASRTWQMIKRHGIVEAVKRVVKRAEATVGYEALVKAGLQDFAFEAVVLRHPAAFDQETVTKAAERLRENARDR